jgi:NADPH:quinone reductase-like Zn-dependent oxidoreductase
MHAGVITKWGGPEVVEYATVPRPSPGDGEILVKVEACALNHLDVLVRRGVASARLSLPHVSGCDIAGVVEEGDGVGAKALVGLRVVVDPDLGGFMIGAECWGGLADYVVAPAARAIPVPDGASPERYAALPMAYGTAYHMLFTRAGLAEGETVVVLGAAGGVGVACVQLALQARARVIACSTSDTKLQRLRELGASDTVNVGREVLRRRVRALTGSGADLVIDFLGQQTWEESLRCVRRGGRVATCGATTGHLAPTDLRYVWSRELTILGSDGWTGDDLRSVLNLVDAGDLDPVIGAVFPLSRITEAMGELDDRRVVGKVVVVPDDAASLPAR